MQKDRIKIKAFLQSPKNIAVTLVVLLVVAGLAFSLGWQMRDNSIASPDQKRSEEATSNLARIPAQTSKPTSTSKQTASETRAPSKEQELKEVFPGKIEELAYGKVLKTVSSVTPSELETIKSAMGEFLLKSSSQPGQDINQVREAYHIEISFPGSEESIDYYLYLRDGDSLIQHGSSGYCSLVQEDLYWSVVRLFYPDLPVREPSYRPDNLPDFTAAEIDAARQVVRDYFEASNNSDPAAILKTLIPAADKPHAIDLGGTKVNLISIDYDKDNPARVDYVEKGPGRKVNAKIFNVIAFDVSFAVVSGDLASPDKSTHSGGLDANWTMVLVREDRSSPWLIDWRVDDN